MAGVPVAGAALLLLSSCAISPSSCACAASSNSALSLRACSAGCCFNAPAGELGFTGRGGDEISPLAGDLVFKGRGGDGISPLVRCSPIEARLADGAAVSSASELSRAASAAAAANLSISA